VGTHSVARRALQEVHAACTALSTQPWYLLALVGWAEVPRSSSDFYQAAAHRQRYWRRQRLAERRKQSQSRVAPGRSLGPAGIVPCCGSSLLLATAEPNRHPQSRRRPLSQPAVEVEGGDMNMPNKSARGGCACHSLLGGVVVGQARTERRAWLLALSAGQETLAASVYGGAGRRRAWYRSRVSRHGRVESIVRFSPPDPCCTRPRGSSS